MKIKSVSVVVLLVLTALTTAPVGIKSQTTDSLFFLGMLILEEDHQAVLDGIQKFKDFRIGNMVLIPPENWDVNLIEEDIRKANDLGLYIVIESYNYSTNRGITPSNFADWKSKYPFLMGVLVSEIGGIQIDRKFWEDNSTGTIKTRCQAEQSVITNIAKKMQLAEYKSRGARIFLQENVISYASANTSHCDVFVSKVFNAPNVELMIGLARGMVNTYNIPSWGLWIDTWRGWTDPPAYSPNDVERALYEGWFYGAKYFFFEQACFFGTWNDKYIILDSHGELTEYGKVFRKFYTFLQNHNTINYDQPTYSSSIAVMIGQSGWGGRGPNWGLWNQAECCGDFDYTLLNLFFPAIGDNWHIADPYTTKHFVGLPYGMVDIISIYASASTMRQYKVIIGLGWSLLTNAIMNNIRDYVRDGGVFVASFTFTHTNKDIDDLRSRQAWTGETSSLFGVQVAPRNEDESITADADLYNIIFTKNTFWYPWSNTFYFYSYSNPAWFWKFAYTLSPSDSTKVIAWINGQTVWPNAFIIENKIGNGYTYIINTRNPNSLPNGVFTNALFDFINRLCSYFVKPTLGLVYPAHEAWLAQGQANGIVYLIHDNSTTTHSLQYNISLSTAHFYPRGQYLLFDWMNDEFLSVRRGPWINITLTLQPNASKLIYLKEYRGRPEILYANLPLTRVLQTPLHYSLETSEVSANQTVCIQIFTGGSRPWYLQANGGVISTWNYDAETSIVTINYTTPERFSSELVLDVIFGSIEQVSIATVFLGILTSLMAIMWSPNKRKK